jgi:hypothetical protein
MRVNPTGNVGIGTTSPDQLLHLRSPSANTYLRFTNDTVNGYVGVSNGQQSVDLYASSDHPVRFLTNNTERARIDSSGRLLVGTSTTVAASTGVEGGFQHQGTTSGYANANFGRWTNDNGSYALYFGKSRGTSVGSHAIVQNNDFLGFLAFEGSDGTALKRAAAIAAAVDGTPGADDMPGRLVFSTTADGASSPTEALRIDSAQKTYIGSTALTFRADYLTDAPLRTAPLGAGSTQSGAESYTGSTDVRYHNSFSNPNGIVGSISTDGSATAYNTSSDYRLKENVVPLTGAADRVNQLQVHRFNFIADPSKTVDGFIAHEAQEIVPECVTGTKDEVDADGNPVYQGIDQSKLVPLLTAALQEAIAEIASLKDRVAALEAS